jgi:hypothetical protein
MTPNNRVEWDAGDNVSCFLILLWPAPLKRAVRRQGLESYCSLCRFQKR